MRKWRKFKSIKRSYYSLMIILFLCVLCSFLEIFISNRAMVVKWNGHYYFPTYGSQIPGTTFDLGYDYETNYRELREKIRASENPEGNFVWLPAVPFSPYELDVTEGAFPPEKPSPEKKHFFGTDTSGRDVLARLLYGFRIALLFSLGVLAAEYAVGVLVGMLMGYVGGRFDLILQRIIEIWSNIPFLYVIMILSSIASPTFGSLMFIMVLFSWINMTWYMRTAAYRERARDYVAAAKCLGASKLRILVRHILPNALPVVITFLPFTLSGALVSLTSLDYLGFGLPPPTPSWGELLAQGTSRLEAWWILGSVLVAMISFLVMITFVGEGIREAFDPKDFASYR